MTFRGGSFLPGLASLVLGTHTKPTGLGHSLASGLGSLQVRTGCCASFSISSTRMGSRAPFPRSLKPPLNQKFSYPPAHAD